MQIRVYYEDTDCGKIVYHSNYFNFCERARSELFFQNGIKFFDENSGYAVKKILNANFIKPAILGDLLEVKSKLISHKKTSFILHQKILKNNELIFEMDIQMVHLCLLKPIKIPKEVLEFLLAH